MTLHMTLYDGCSVGGHSVTLSSGMTTGACVGVLLSLPHIISTVMQTLPSLQQVLPQSLTKVNDKTNEEFTWQ